MAGRAKLLLQAAAVTVVALLIALLGWQVVAEGKSRNLRDAVWDGETPMAPAFELSRLDGAGSVSLESLRGNAVVINFWASWCEPCKEESPRLEEAWQRFRERDVVVLGIDTHDFRSEGQRFVDRYALSYPILHDKGGSAFKRYGLVGLPETMFVDRGGRIVAWVQGPLSEEDLDRNIALALEGAA
jgi:peroxiredoxin